MPYASVRDLPPKVRRALPTGAQHVFRAAFNSACERYPHEEERCFSIAWAAVKRAGYSRRSPGHWRDRRRRGRGR